MHACRPSCVCASATVVPFNAITTTSMIRCFTEARLFALQPCRPPPASSEGHEIMVFRAQSLSGPPMSRVINVDSGARQPFPQAGIVFGFDQDTESIFNETLDFLETAGVQNATFNILTPYPGTTLHQ